MAMPEAGWPPFPITNDADARVWLCVCVCVCVCVCICMLSVCMRACARVREWLQGVHFMCIAHTHAHALTRRMRSMHTCIRLHAHVSAGNARMTAHACAGRRACVFHAYMHGRVIARLRACVSVCATRADACCAAPAAPTHLLSWSPPTGTFGSGAPLAYDMCCTCICVRLRVPARWRARAVFATQPCAQAGRAHDAAAAALSPPACAWVQGLRCCADECLP